VQDAIDDYENAFDAITAKTISGGFIQAIDPAFAVFVPKPVPPAVPIALPDAPAPLPPVPRVAPLPQ